MAKPVITQHQPSITEWFAAIGEEVASEAFRTEDNRKVDRLELLYQTIGLPYERPQRFAARELWDIAPAFAQVLQTQGDELCAIRLVPTREGLPKLRQRGLALRVCYQSWFRKLAINPDDYVAYVCPHCDRLEWSAIFVVNHEAIFGEIIAGMAAQLTHGDTQAQSRQFFFNFSTWQWSDRDTAAETQAQRMVAALRVADITKQHKLANDLGAGFSHEYLTGYFETTVWPGEQIYFIDYNRLLPTYIATPTPLIAAGAVSAALTGAVAFAGNARGRVVKISEANVANAEFTAGSILVCDNTDVRYLPYMRKAAAIITNRGGILSHAAIIARELKIPCIIGTKTATQVLQDGDRVEVDVTKGVIKIMKLNQ